MKRKHLIAALTLVSFLLFGIQPALADTKYIRDDATGGDCADAIDPIGTWDSTTKTCTLGMDVSGTIQIDTDAVTLDGNGYTVSGPGQVPVIDPGIWLSAAKTRVTIKNVTVEGFTNGIYLAENSSQNILEGNTASNNKYGIHLYDSTTNVLVGNIADSNSWYGILLEFFSDNNTLEGNTTDSNLSYGIFLYNSSNNTLTGNTASNNKIGILLLSSSNNNQIYNNNFIANETQAYADGGSVNVFNNMDPSIGGNFWDGYTGTDTDGDGIGETPYDFVGGQDEYPWVIQDGWKAKTPVEMIEDLQSMVIELNLHQGIENSLDAKLQAVQQALADLNENNDVAAINALVAFINAVEAQRGNKISDADADELIAAAQAIIAAIESQ